MLAEIFWYFLRLGSLGFGGPIALVAQMQRDLVVERKWISEEDFNQSISLIKAMPGPLAFSTAAYMGTRRGGFWGGAIAGWTLVLPAFLLMLILATTYESYSAVPLINAALKGMQAASLAIIIFSIQSLVGHSWKKWWFWVFLVMSGLLLRFDVAEPFVILLSGALAVLAYKKASSKTLYAFAPVFLVHPERLAEMSWMCVKAGAFVFGTGLAMVPILEADFVTRTGWLAQSEFMDALAFGQMTPGPVLITVTFAGYRVSGLLGALIATVSIFFASFVHMTTWFPKLVGWLSKQKWIGDFTLGALAAVIAALLLVSLRLASMNSSVQNMIMLASLLLMFAFKIPSWLVIILGGVAGAFAIS